MSPENARRRGALALEERLQAIGHRGDQLVVLELLGVVHLDVDPLHARLRQLDPDLLGRPKLGIAIEDPADLVEALEADDGRLLHDVEVGVEDVAALDLEVAVDELFRVVDPDLREGVVIDVLEDVVEF